jgi:hypothetical protein
MKLWRLTALPPTPWLAAPKLYANNGFACPLNIYGALPMVE